MNTASLTRHSLRYTLPARPPSLPFYEEAGIQIRLVREPSTLSPQGKRT